jgi:hypothetical protein
MKTASPLHARQRRPSQVAGTHTLEDVGHASQAPHFVRRGPQGHFVLIEELDDARAVAEGRPDDHGIEKISTRVIILRAGVVVADDSASRLRDLMQAPSLEDVFSQLTVTEDADLLASELLETMRD